MISQSLASNQTYQALSSKKKQQLKYHSRQPSGGGPKFIMPKDNRIYNQDLNETIIKRQVNQQQQQYQQQNYSQYEDGKNETQILRVNMMPLTDSSIKSNNKNTQNVSGLQISFTNQSQFNNVNRQNINDSKYQFVNQHQNMYNSDTNHLGQNMDSKRSQIYTDINSQTNDLYPFSQNEERDVYSNTDNMIDNVFGENEVDDTEIEECNFIEFHSDTNLSPPGQLRPLPQVKSNERVQSKSFLDDGIYRQNIITQNIDNTEIPQISNNQQNYIGYNSQQEEKYQNYLERKNSLFNERSNMQDQSTFSTYDQNNKNKNSFIYQSRPSNVSKTNTTMCEDKNFKTSVDITSNKENSSFVAQNYQEFEKSLQKSFQKQKQIDPKQQNTNLSKNVFDILMAKQVVSENSFRYDNDPSTNANSAIQSATNLRNLTQNESQQVIKLQNLQFDDIRSQPQSKQQKQPLKSSKSTFSTAKHSRKNNKSFGQVNMSKSGNNTRRLGDIKFDDKLDNKNPNQSFLSPQHNKIISTDILSNDFDDINQLSQDYKRKQSQQSRQSNNMKEKHSINIASDSFMKVQTLEIHKLRISNAKLRDNYSRSQKRLREVEQVLHKYRKDQQVHDIVKQKDFQYIIRADQQIEYYQEHYNSLLNNYNSKVQKISLFIVEQKDDNQKCKEKLSNRDALIQATKFALDHVIENAKQEVVDSESSMTLQTLFNIRNQLQQI
ncbi:UNKNOWN [Stylonychia lemnae]|uniref:Uncharacterized protein n=1 Tax=Stylonychia lemnae TaxID=5949 RepID=A0A078ATW5_STYLE|nr:UNKNOWN [Stylonychia lemnae]|eukprot:CDW84682.1 UNKNOWN [Stylonychia lemnae]